MYVETDDVAGYLADLEGMIAEMDKRDYGVTMQVFVGDTGETVGTVMISLGAADGATLGRALDARTEKLVHGCCRRLLRAAADSARVFYDL